METHKYTSATPIFSGNDFNQSAISIGGCGARAGATTGALSLHRHLLRQSAMLQYRTWCDYDKPRPYLILMYNMNKLLHTVSEDLHQTDKWMDEDTQDLLHGPPPSEGDNDPLWPCGFRLQSLKIIDMPEIPSRVTIYPSLKAIRDFDT